MIRETAVQPKLGELLTKYLDRQAEAETLGLTAFDTAEVLPYDAGPVQPIDPRLAWDETLAVLGYFAVPTKGWKVPPQWGALVAQHEPEVALPMGVGNFPQMVRSFHALLQTAAPADLRPKPGRALELPELLAWADQVGTSGAFPQAVLALAGLRLAKQFERARALAARLDAQVPAGLRTLWDNEKAVLAWHAGDAESALAQWEKLPDALPIRFNRMMALLSLGRRDAARTLGPTVVAELPETAGWHHLARLYLALTQLGGG